MSDPIGALLGDSPLLPVLTEAKPEVLDQTRLAYAALYAEAHPLPASALHALAAVVAAQQGSAALYTHHLDAGADAELVRSALAGEAPADPLLAAVLRHADIVSVSPALAEPEDQDALAAAGVDEDLAVLVSQLVAFESYLIRIVAGAQALTAAGAGPEAAEAPAAGASAGELPAPARIPASRGRDGQRSDRTRTGRLRPTAFTQRMLDWEPWIATPSADELTPEQIESFAAKSGTGNVYFRLISRTPGVTKARSALDNEVFLSRAGLPKGERELAAAVSSKVNDCVYCASVHARKATQRTKREADVDRVLAVTLPRDHDWIPTEVTPLAEGQDERWTVLVETSARLAALVPEFSAEDVARLRALGLSDLEIADLIASTAFFGWANRLMLTLGEPYWPEGE
ncbi:peroxidase-related enzyme [Brevibacterium album]|uniref:peroxidase-related enzyme n=1 Tax=Brevibacterium album TaxID=417948 RepID=UPI00040B1B0E|nr:peroxidase-related enzyme [Brevibacterium album]